MSPWKGILAATVTPFREDGSIDFDVLAVQVRRLEDAGTAGVVVNAVSGEGGSLTPPERADVVRASREALSGRAALIATAGSVGDHETAGDIRAAAAAGADGLMLIAPFFYRLNKVERIAHFEHMGKICGLPYIIYNTTYASPMLSIDEYEAIAERSPTFAGVKEGDHTQASEAVRRLGAQIGIYTSRDTYINELGFAGGSGAVTYSSCVVPELTVDLWNAVEARRHERALELQQMLNPIALKLVTHSFPSPLKAAMKILGWDAGHLRTPLIELSVAEIEELRRMLAGYHPQLAAVA